MYLRLICNDIRKSKWITGITLLFITASALLMSLAAILTFHLAGSIDSLMLQAKTPHFLQMHQGELNQERLSAFASQNEQVEVYQTLEFLNVEGSQIQLGKSSLADTVQDNGFSTQSKLFDYLLDLDGKIIQPAEGELYVPICYMKEGLTKVGDEAVVLGQRFKVAGFLRDAQMNSELASSKRFLVSEKDYEKLQGLGRVEYLIEFRVKDLSQLGQFETAYSEAGLEANGPAITYPLFKIMNAISDGLMIVVIILISLLVVVVALMCIRFTLLAKIEEDYKEIGMMKAIGIRVKEIKKIYLAKYGMVTAIGCLLGLGLSNLCKGPLLENIRLYFGESGNELWAYGVGTIGVLMIFGVVILYVNRILRRFKQLSAADAIRFGGNLEKQSHVRSFNLYSKKWMSTNVFLGIKDLLVRKKLYLTMLMVVIISTFILIVPRNLYHTISSKHFIGYMGIGLCDLQMNIQQRKDAEQKALEIAKALEQDGDIETLVVLTTKTFDVILEDGRKERIKVELGNHQVFPIQYIKGQGPQLENEIALSVLNASELEKEVGDSIVLAVDGVKQQFKVCGIYSDITNGGKTAKASFSAPNADTMWSVISIKLRDSKMSESKAESLGTQFKFAKVASIEEYIQKVFGLTLTAIQKAAMVAIIIAVLIDFLITVLFMKMLIAKDHESIGILKALGFHHKDLTIQYMTRSVGVVIIAVILGVCLASTLGELLAGALMSGLGVISFKMIVSPIQAYILCPLLIIITVIVATLVGTTDIRRQKISENIKE